MQCLHDKRKRKWPCWSGQHGTGNDLVEEVNMEPEMTLVKSSTWNRKWPCWRGQHITGNDLVEEVNMEPEMTLLKRSTWNRKLPCWRGRSARWRAGRSSGSRAFSRHSTRPGIRSTRSIGRRGWTPGAYVHFMTRGRMTRAGLPDFSWHTIPKRG
jgi:hypothetical protein